MNIGRLGGLAVALGIGWALAGPACTASATPSDEGGATAASAERGSASRASTAKRAAPSSGSESTGRATPARSAAAAGAAPKNESPAPAATTIKPAVAAAAQSLDESREASADVAPDLADTPAVAVSETVETVADAAVTAVAYSAAPGATNAPVAARIGRAKAHVAVVTAQSVAVADAVPGTGTGTGDIPAQATAAWSALAWVRREFEQLTAGQTAVVPVATATVSMSPNLLTNPGAEVGDASLSGNGSVSVPGWTVTGTPTVIGYGTPRNSWPIGVSFKMPDLPAFMGFPTASSGPADGGAQFFGGGNVGTSTLTQTIDLSAAGAAIDLGTTNFNFGGWFGGWLINPSAGSAKVTFLDSNKAYLGSADLNKVSLFDRWFQTGLKERETSGVLPEGTRYAQVVVNLEGWKPLLPGFNVDYNSAFADNLSFSISAPLPAPADPLPPVSQVGDLDHVFMVMMENKGYSDILGSPNAPYINSLINAYGFADNYYGHTHPSLPNYYPIVGGSDFGLTYNCETPCINADATLASMIDDAGKTWRGYAQSMPYPGALVASGDYSPEQLPFLAFEGIGDNPAYAAEHVFPLEQMAIDLQSAETAPDYLWYSPNEDFNGEGPVDFPWGVLKFAISQITPYHQYNVPALDQFLSETVPVVLNSNVWNDPTESSVLVITFDEDNNNTSLGFGNELNHIVTVVIPSPGAILDGMRAGSFTATNRYDHYSLLRMIEDALDLPTLTNNDKYAAPMNEFWNAGVVPGPGSSVV